MNSKTNSRSLLALGAGVLLGTALAANANTIINFQVDMSTAPGFDTNSQTVEVRGNFEGWGAGPVALTNNPGGVNPYLFTGTTNFPQNSIVIAYKYVIQPGAAFEGSHNRLLRLPSTSGASITTPLPYYNDTPPAPFTNSVTFQVNMAQQINTGAFDTNASSVQARGIFNGWGGTAAAQTNDPTILTTNQFGLVTSNVYVYTYEIGGSPGQTIDFKYHIDNGTPLDNWEAPAPGTGDPNDNNNRFFNMSSGPTQTLPIVYFNDQPYSPVATNDITFQVDMSTQILLGLYDPTTGTVSVRGDFNSWGTTQCTNDPTALNTNIYKTVVQIHDGVGATHQFKFFSTVTANGGWETNANNRTLQIVQGNAQTLPAVYFDDWFVDPVDVLTADTTVTFSVSMTNAVGSDSHVFDPALDQVVINGVPTFMPWGVGGLPVLTNNPIPSIIYSVDLLLPKGSFLQQSYKYGMNGLNDEPGGNHVRYIRSTGTYVMPMDVFGNIVVEPSFGNFTITRGTPGHVHLSWLGRPGVHLQVKSGLTDSWVDHPETDGLSAIDWPISGSTSFFRLIKP
jgi:hypothetical protein